MAFVYNFLHLNPTNRTNSGLVISLDLIFDLLQRNSQALASMETVGCV